MTAFLQAGSTVLAMAEFYETQPVDVGDRFEAFDGSERTSVTARKRRWRGTTRPLTAAEYTAHTTAILATPPIAFTGTAMGGTVQCSVSILSAPYVRDGTGFLRIIDFEVRER